MLIIAIILVGMLAGAAAQLVFRSRKRPIDWTAAIVVGLIGSFVGGLLFSLIAGDGLAIRPSGLIGSIIGAIVVAGAANRAGTLGAKLFPRFVTRRIAGMIQG